MFFLMFSLFTPPLLPLSPIPWGWNVLESEKPLCSWCHKGWRNTKNCIHIASQMEQKCGKCWKSLIFKDNCEFLSVIWVKWKQTVCSITVSCSKTLYSLFLHFFVLEIFKFKYDNFYIRDFASISKFKWFEQPWKIVVQCIDQAKLDSSLPNHQFKKKGISFHLSGEIENLWEKGEWFLFEVLLWDKWKTLKRKTLELYVWNLPLLRKSGAFFLFTDTDTKKNFNFS